ncbi:MAG: hypothetical protein IJV70_02115 [Clostridia bacterium]|nr:hypothetical protein [Clostridia bacterium]
MNGIMLDYILSLFPTHFRPAIKNFLTIYTSVSEIRLRLNLPLSFTARDDNITTALTVTYSDIDYIVAKLTDNNLILYEPLIRLGFIPLKYNIRAGVGGDAFLADGVIKSIRRISYINIRIPFSSVAECDDVIDYIKSKNYRVSLLAVSAPGCGKTTLLRSLAAILSSPPHLRRISVIDTKRELYCDTVKSGLIDLFSGYPKAEGISIATGYFNPQYIICDELGSSHETEAVCEALNAGVPIIASAHGNDINQVKRRKNIAFLLENNVFDAAVNIHRRDNKYYYDITEI